jgi:hypothetical protein
MTHADWVRWVRNELVRIAADRYPNDPRKQMIYSIGFLESQLASAFRTDSRVLDDFRRSIERADRFNR